MGKVAKLGNISENRNTFDVISVHRDRNRGPRSTARLTAFNILLKGGSPLYLHRFGADVETKVFGRLLDFEIGLVRNMCLQPTRNLSSSSASIADKKNENIFARFESEILI